MREAHDYCELPCQGDELQAWSHDAHGVVAIAKVLVEVGCGVTKVPGIEDRCEIQPPSSTP